MQLEREDQTEISPDKGATFGSKYVFVSKGFFPIYNEQTKQTVS